ncbi:MAG: hypothetical protein AAF491_06295, partial [Verrucomicrobiota bacterium]
RRRKTVVAEACFLQMLRKAPIYRGGRAAMEWEIPFQDKEIPRGHFLPPQPETSLPLHRKAGIKRLWHAKEKCVRSPG